VGTATVRIPLALRQFSAGRGVVTVEIEGTATVSTVLDALTAECPGVIDRVLDEQGALRRHVHIYIGDEEARVLGGLGAPVSEGAEVSILPAVSGGTDDPRLAAAAGVRRLAHAISAHEADDATLHQISAFIVDVVPALEDTPRRERIVPTFGEGAVIATLTKGRHPMDDRAVAGPANATSVDFAARREGDEIVADANFGAAFEGAPGRVHGGMVAAVFDDLVGFILGMVGQPGFTGRITVVYKAPVPTERPVEFRARMRERTERTLVVDAEVRLAEKLLATCEATMVLVDGERWAKHVRELLDD
jgi:molybdopterin converting factor small subunit/acyl-coenzyme A thioesterase PaaI-like protein